MCKTCPHFFSKEEPFFLLSLDVRGYAHLGASLDQYIKGEFLCDDNKFHCRTCDKLVDCMVRTCIKVQPYRPPSDLLTIHFVC